MLLPYFVLFVWNCLLSILPKFMIHTWNYFTLKVSECIVNLYFNNVFQPFLNETLHLPVLQDSLTSSCSIALNINPILPMVQVAPMTGNFLSILQPSLHTSFTHSFQHSISKHFLFSQGLMLTLMISHLHHWNILCPNLYKWHLVPSTPTQNSVAKIPFWQDPGEACTASVSDAVPDNYRNRALKKSL